ncbi:hypothetical protein HH800_15740 [Sphingobium yanoikuyae]|uniref:Uncharacterized protein n=1 Tax=Sphingobium yanoikuyae TaxID=13690 RepID=A0A6M4G869_SPHYA|nr:hypothetical protein [Sphingobium yanoikuyae]QJR03502.1 hypothetical protein HH800_15740 [Sphingobium yanoikuyae]
MYQIIGVQTNGKEVAVAATAKAAEALTHFRAAQNLPFAQIRVLSPDGQQISGFELSRRYDAEIRATMD